MLPWWKFEQVTNFYSLRQTFSDFFPSLPLCLFCIMVIVMLTVTVMITIVIIIIFIICIILLPIFTPIIIISVISIIIISFIIITSVITCTFWCYKAQSKRAAWDKWQLKKEKTWTILVFIKLYFLCCIISVSRCSWEIWLCGTKRQCVQSLSDSDVSGFQRKPSAF